MYYIIFVITTVLSQLNSIYLYKKYQLTAGTSFRASVLYMIINGILSALMPLGVLLVTGQPLQATPYSLLFAAATVICSAMGLILTFRAYALGQIAIVNIMTTIGGIVIPCLWGVLFLGEELSVQSLVAILIMLGAVVFITPVHEEKFRKNLILLYLVIILFNCFVTMLSKQHQIEAVYATVDTYSYSVWVGVIRTVLFGILGIFFLLKGKGIREVPQVKKSSVFAVLSSAVSGTCYIVTLFTAAVLPVVITSPLGTGIGILMSTTLPHFIYHENLTKRQLFGTVLSFVGIMLFLLDT